MDRRALALVALFPLAAACGGTGNPPAGQTSAATAPTGRMGTATLGGRILFQGTPPAVERIEVTADPACAAQHKDGI
jgi:hypothetical protein